MQYLTRPGLGPHLAGPSAFAPARREAPIGGYASRRLSVDSAQGHWRGPARTTAQVHIHVDTTYRGPLPYGWPPPAAGRMEAVTETVQDELTDSTGGQSATPPASWPVLFWPVVRRR